MKEVDDNKTNLIGKRRFYCARFVIIWNFLYWVLKASSFVFFSSGFDTKSTSSSHLRVSSKEEQECGRSRRSSWSLNDPLISYKVLDKIELLVQTLRFLQQKLHFEVGKWKNFKHQEQWNCFPSNSWHSKVNHWWIELTWSLRLCNFRQCGEVLHKLLPRWCRCHSSKVSQHFQLTIKFL